MKRLKVAKKFKLHHYINKISCAYTICICFCYKIWKFGLCQANINDHFEEKIGSTELMIKELLGWDQMKLKPSKISSYLQ